MGLSGLSAGEDEIPSIAILYMKNLGQADDEPWAYGLTEDLIIEMSRLGNIRVASMNPRELVKLYFMDTVTDG